MNRLTAGSRYATILFAAAMVSAWPTGDLHAQTFTVLHSFAHASDGQTPEPH